MSIGYDDSDMPPVNLLGLTLDGYLALRGYLDIHQDDHALAAEGGKYYYLCRIPNDPDYQYAAKIEVNSNTYAALTVYRTPTYPGGSGTLATINNNIDGNALRTAQALLREGVVASGITVGSGMNWHTHIGASGANPRRSGLGGITTTTWRGLANSTEYLFELEALDAAASIGITVVLTKLKKAS